MELLPPPAPPETPPPNPVGRFEGLSPDKLRGGYYTDRALTAWLCQWAIRGPDERVLEPSCGAGAFAQAAAEQLVALGAAPAAAASQLVAVEISDEEARATVCVLRPYLGQAASKAVVTSDFFAWWDAPERPVFDAVVGNPPFIRYQSFPEPHRTRAMHLMARLGLKPNRLTNIWVPFVAAAAAALRPGGRLALVLPAELLQVTYAAQLRSFLTDRFARLDIVACNELFFDGAEQEVVLLLADGALARASETNACRVTMTEAQTVGEITGRAPAVVLANAQPKAIQHDSEKWLKYFLSAREIAFMRELRGAPSVAPLSAHGAVDVGVVTGKNEFFVLSRDQVRALGLDGHTTPLVSRSAQLRGARLTEADWQRLDAAGDRVHLLHLRPMNGTPPNAALGAYIAAGEGRGVHRGYKCSIRKPWYAVPSVWTPDGFLFRQIYDFPRLVHNRAGATSTDTIHRFRAAGDPAATIVNTYTYLTAASAEIEGRSYGGGVLELEPTEAERLLVPATLGEGLPLDDCDRLVTAGRLDAVLEEHSRLLLQQHLGLSSGDCALLRGIWVRMRDRRMARRRSPRAVAAAEAAVGAGTESAA